MKSDALETTYYAATAYRSNRIPNQPPSAERSWIRRFSKVRLPWGLTQQVAPDDFLTEASPEDLRRVEKGLQEKKEKLVLGTYVPALYEDVDFHDRHDQERFRFSLWSARSQFWIYLHSFGKWLFLIGLIPGLFTLLVAIKKLKGTWIEIAIDSFYSFFIWFSGIPIFCWAIAALVIRFLPHLWVKPSRGPIWEINRRTGLVTLFDYDNNGEYKKNGTIGELTAPFYEFDAYIATIPDRQGLSMNVLYIAHRYRDIVINFRPLFAPGEGQLCCALWDFLQNYMDTSRPLPDLPRYEQYRHLDPTTAEYDRKTRRNPRFWIDMDDATFEQELYDMRGKIDQIDTLQRPNLMARYVEYVD
ncbi:hypothetical protein [Pseudomonas sp. MH10out]|uniref:hypothetical protein n=1 Tax=Pseudomonas sp. MH10out TaxID=3048628 RepID=UPI002B22BCF8|nr:hypothetical protein [Pseudomonas sp. MH10out]MEB0075746.1 hypothetical protein [Pseudomonas sp. MH10out]